MRKKLYLTLDLDVCRKLKEKRINISRYVEKLVLKEWAFGTFLQRGCDPSSNLGRRMEAHATLGYVRYKKL